MSIRAMQRRDVDAVLAMLQTSFDRRLSRYLTHTQHGAGAFLESLLSNPRLIPSIDFTVATGEDDEPLGFAEFSQQGESAHLSYVCVSERSRRQGIATALIDAYVGAHAPTVLSLNVFADNAPALRLYEKRGFQVRAEYIWARRPLPGASEPAILNSPLDSIAMHTLYGFCTLNADLAGATRRVGWIGEEVLRCYDVASFRDDALLSSMRATVPTTTEAFVIVPPEERLNALPADAEVLTRALRLERFYPSGSDGGRP
ncbi:MAG TPA: GNAT family N-acetyltransferase [Coriobacteriia bacterium]|nr:GNAT family N-acetyltransferase [Coriobacteriia bacterium]